MHPVNSKRAFLYLLVASVALSAIIGIAVLIFGNFGDFEIKVLLTTLTVTVTSILGLACGAPELLSQSHRVFYGSTSSGTAPYMKLFTPSYCYR